MIGETIPVTSRILLDCVVAAKAPWSGVVRKGQIIRIVDSHGQQAVDTLFYRADDPQERYSAQDTLREQGSAYIEKGTKIMSRAVST